MAGSTRDSGQRPAAGSGAAGQRAAAGLVRAGPKRRHAAGLGRVKHPMLVHGRLMLAGAAVKPRRDSRPHPSRSAEGCGARGRGSPEAGGQVGPAGGRGMRLGRGRGRGRGRGISADHRAAAGADNALALPPHSPPPHTTDGGAGGRGGDGAGGERRGGDGAGGLGERGLRWFLPLGPSCAPPPSPPPPPRPPRRPPRPPGPRCAEACCSASRSSSAAATSGRLRARAPGRRGRGVGTYRAHGAAK
jgi:hypothetical protein